MISERRYPDRVGQTYAITYDRSQLWYWFPRMRRDEALVFKVYDSLKDGRARWTAHTAFNDPTSPPNARPPSRQSGICSLTTTWGRSPTPTSNFTRPT